MKQLVLLPFLLFGLSASAQSTFPNFLEGTWQVANAQSFERWDKLNDQSLKGFAYRMENGKMSTTEYLDISKKEKGLVYTATVLNQNAGKPVSFTQKVSDSALVFENLAHGYPKRIIYKKLSDWELEVELQGAGDKKGSFRMTKVGARSAVSDTTVMNPNYDPAMAQRLNADEYGMKNFVLVILKTGPKEITDKAVVSNLFMDHMDNIDRLVAERKLIVAGPLKKNDKDYRGIFILTNVNGVEEAKSLLQSDAAIKAGLLTPELYDWYGSAALPEYLEANDKIWKKKH